MENKSKIQNIFHGLASRMLRYEPNLVRMAPLSEGTGEQDKKQNNAEKVII